MEVPRILFFNVNLINEELQFYLEEENQEEKSKYIPFVSL